VRPYGLVGLLVRWIRSGQQEKAFLHDISAIWEQFPNWPVVSAERARELHVMPYSKYLETPEWRSRAAQIKASSGSRCAACGSETRLQIHHLTYDRRGYERPSDLLTLCRPCHKLVHRRRLGDTPSA
jgi:5-methylcytosine-specific restriction endonuclease McrA